MPPEILTPLSLVHWRSLLVGRLDSVVLVVVIVVETVVVVVSPIVVVVAIAGSSFVHPEIKTTANKTKENKTIFLIFYLFVITTR